MAGAITTANTNTDEHIALVRNARARMGEDRLSEPEPLIHFSDKKAWVLLADPGAGKTDAFKTLSTAEGGYYTTARDFLDLGVPADQQGLLFIDGIDEISAGTTPGGPALGQIRAKLQTLGTSKFRLACREIDWRGNADSAALKRFVGDSNFLELHLAPLDPSQTVKLISHWKKCDLARAQQFIRDAEHRDLAGLLDNPQTLKMLCKATSDVGWPESKTKAYEMACVQLLREQNQEHLAEQRKSAIPDDQLLAAAGYLCAVMLLSGSASIAPQHSIDAKMGVVVLPELVSGETVPPIAYCRIALQTRLFRSNGHADFQPVHRTIAEYLAARYLMTRIEDGLPFNRVLALMLGLDAGIVPELRGLHAWLAATAHDSVRANLIGRDPLGVVLNGDVRAFSRTEKLLVLDALGAEAAKDVQFRRLSWSSEPFGALATADMESDFKKLLQAPDRSQPALALLDCALDALAHGYPMPAQKPDLEKIVRDTGYWPGSRKEALNILISYARRDDNWSVLKTLLNDVHTNAVEDLEDELLGTLLLALYPAFIDTAEVWRYFRQPKSDRLVGSYWHFWHVFASEVAPSKNIPALLDALHQSGFQLTSADVTLREHQVVGELLVRGVTQLGDEIEVQRLYDWFTLGLDKYEHSPLDTEHQQRIATWLGTHPTQYKSLFTLSLTQHINTGDQVHVAVWKSHMSLYRAPEPDDADAWYLSMAQACSDEDLRHGLVNEAVRVTFLRKGPDAQFQLLERWAQEHSYDAAWVQTQLHCDYPPIGYEQEHIESKLEHKRRQAEENQQKLAFFRQTLPCFEQGPAHLGALAEIANAYLNFFRNSKNNTPEERLLELLDGDREWVRLALQGLRQSLFRSDLPSVAQIIDLNIQGRRYNLAVPCLAAMELRFVEEPQAVLDLSEDILGVVVAFRLINNYEGVPAWFKRLLAQRPDIVADVLLVLVGKQIAASKENVDGLYALAHDKEYSQVARQVTTSLIANFPVKASKTQLQSCRFLIVAMLNCIDREEQLRLIQSKISFPVMDVGQRVYWFTAGLAIAPEIFLKQAQQYVGKSQLRASHLYAMVSEIRAAGGFPDGINTATTCYLIELLGPSAKPFWSVRTDKAFWVTPGMEMGRYVEGLVSNLGGNSDAAAGQALAHLQQRHDLKQWADYLNRAAIDQRIAWRKATFRPASVMQVCRTLANSEPANAADLWALTVDHLMQLASEIRNGSTNDYRQYWAGASPKVEDDCRDTLLSDLKRALGPVGVLAEPEGRYADAKRADIKVMASSHHVPIEIKRETHPDLWKAIPNQLIAKYGRDPASDGYGIYLVFWFSGDIKAVPSDGGRKPKSPQELQARLAETVPEELRHKIAVLVVDCSRPVGG